MGVSKNSGTPKWMVKIMENPIKMDDLGVPLFSQTLTSSFPFGARPTFRVELLDVALRHVTPEGEVKGLHADGSKIRDRIQALEIP